ncbi:hypothetical protein Tco_0556081 [Tanacetum coccineum]
MGLWYSKDTDMSLTTYADANHAGCQDTRRIVIFQITPQFLGDNIVCCHSKKQTVHLPSRSIVPLYRDNKSVIALCYNNVQHSRAKHIDVCYHFIKEQVENGIMELYFVWTEYQLADIFTKPLPRERFNFLIEKLGMKSMSSETLKRLAEETDEIISSITTQQTKLDLELVPKEKRLEIGKCNERLNFGKTQREPTFQVVLDALALTLCYSAFLITTDVPEGQDFNALPTDKGIVFFLRELGHTEEINSLNDVVVDQLDESNLRRTFAAIITKVFWKDNSS